MAQSGTSPFPIVYKICTRAAWQEAIRHGAFRGSADDRRDGFIHFSAAHQLAETARKYFHGQHDLVLVSIDPATLGPALRWEPSRGGALFPHLYGPLPMRAVKWMRPLPVGADGLHVFPHMDD